MCTRQYRATIEANGFKLKSKSDFPAKVENEDSAAFAEREQLIDYSNHYEKLQQITYPNENFYHVLICNTAFLAKDINATP